MISLWWLWSFVPVCGVALMVMLAGCGCLVPVGAYPNGSPSCIVGVANPRSLHLDSSQNPETGPISVGNFVLYIDDVLVPSGTIGNFSTGNAHKIHVNSTTGMQFKGILLLLSKPEVRATSWLRPVDLLQKCGDCFVTPIGGVTHRDPQLKQQGVATLQVDPTAPLGLYQFDINLVIVNDASPKSIYYYSQYKLNAVPMTPTQPPTKAPTQAPKLPIAAPAVIPPKSCGFLRKGIFCPLTKCGWMGRVLRLCRTNRRR